MNPLYSKNEITKRFESIIDSIFQENNTTTLKSMSEKIMTGIREIGVNGKLISSCSGK